MRPGNLAGLRALVASAKQDHDGLPAAGEIHSVTRAVVHPQLADAAANRLGITHQAQFHARDALSDPAPGRDVAEIAKPSGEGWGWL